MIRQRLSSHEPVGVLGEAIQHLDSATEPWSVHVEVHLGASVDEDRLRQAVGAALDRHPRARSRMGLSPRWPRRYEWQCPPKPDIDPVDVVDVVDVDGEETLAAARDEFVSRPLSLRTSPPLRLRLARRRGGDVVMLNVHHAAGDGMGALVFLQSVARAYGSRPEAVVDPALSLSAGPRTRGRVLGAASVEMARAARPSARMAPEDGHDAPGYGVHLLALGRTRTRAIIECATAGVTVNDLLLAALHLSVDAWNRGHGAPAGRISVLMPVNLRSRAQWGSGFDNLTFMVPVSTAPSDRLRPEMVLDAVARRTRWVKDQGSAAAVVATLAPLQALPRSARRGIARQAAQERLRPTTLLSNLGRLEHDFDFGPGVGAPRQVWFSPPARMPLGVAIGALTAGDELRLAFRVRHPLMGPAATTRFAAAYQAGLDELITLRLPARRAESRGQAA